LQIHITEFETGVEREYTKFIKLGLFMLTILKALHFMATFEELGFFINLLSSSIRKLETFLVSYIMFGACFTVAYIVIGNEPGEFSENAVGLGVFGRMYLFVWGNGACSFGLMSYPTLYAQETTTQLESNLKYVNICAIWLLYFIQVQFQTMFGLNFIIAIVEENYGLMVPLRKQYIYKSKALLNHECYQLMKHLSKLESYRCLVFAKRCSSDGGSIGGIYDEFDRFVAHSDRTEIMFDDFFADQGKRHDELTHSLEHLCMSLVSVGKGCEVDCEQYILGMQETTPSIRESLEGMTAEQVRRLRASLAAKWAQT
jgi:hypothetical protein